MNTHAPPLSLRPAVSLSFLVARAAHRRAFLSCSEPRGKLLVGFILPRLPKANGWLHQEHEASVARSLGTRMKACGICVGHMISNACPPPRRRILLNYAVFNPDMGYCQGMSDLVAPLLTEIQDESDTFWCFVGLMENTIFISSPRDEDMERQLVGGFCFFLVLNLQGFFFSLPPPPTPPG